VKEVPVAMVLAVVDVAADKLEKGIGGSKKSH